MSARLDEEASYLLNERTDLAKRDHLKYLEILQSRSRLVAGTAWFVAE